MCNVGAREHRSSRNPDEIRILATSSAFPAGLQSRWREINRRQATKNQGGFAMRSHNLRVRDGRVGFWRGPLALSGQESVSRGENVCARAESISPAKPIQIFIPYGAGGVA